MQRCEPYRMVWHRRVGIEFMPLGAVVALVAAIAAIVLDVRKIENKKARTAGIIIASVIVLCILRSRLYS